MRYTTGNPASCRHSKGRSVSGLSSRTVDVYRTCKHPQKAPIGKKYMLDDRDMCHHCNFFEEKK